MINLILFFVSHPSAIFLMAFLQFAGWRALRGMKGRGSIAPLISSLAWMLWAIWEWVISVLTPDANIRFDLFVIIPFLLVLTVVSVYKAFRASA